MPATRAPADNDPITPCKKRRTYIAADTVEDLSPVSPFVFESQLILPDTPPSAATASASAFDPSIPRVWKLHLKSKRPIGGNKKNAIVLSDGKGTTGSEQSCKAPQPGPTGRLQQPWSAR